MKHTFSRSVVTLALAFALVPSAPAQLEIRPTTTLKAETGNNTSAPDSRALGNVSKLPVRSLLYPGAKTRVFATLMGWFGKDNHIRIGYRSDDPAQIRRQIQDMKSRGVDGAILSWYGMGDRLENQTAHALRRAAEQENFTFAVMMDNGALRWNARGLPPTEALIAHLQYAEKNFFTSPAYLRIQGRPVLFEFGLEAHAVDWPRVKSSVSSNPLYMFRNLTGLGRPSDGIYAWGASEQPGYFESFYRGAAARNDKVVAAAARSGFDDKLASWSKGRKVDARCGRTWLQSFEQIERVFSQKNPLEMLQLITWNDYEEGTALEAGIDNCVTVTARNDDKRLTWKIEGEKETLAHIRVFISRDGENLMELATVPANQDSWELPQLAPGKYIAYVQAVGKPFVVNRMSNPVELRVEK